MTKRMLIDATQQEETRVVMTDGNRVEDFDFETASRKQLKGNIYLARVTRVEPSLQAAFIEYGGNRHGFLAFNEIHPDYYRIPMEDREALMAEQEANAARDLNDDDDNPADDNSADPTGQSDDDAGNLAGNQDESRSGNRDHTVDHAAPEADTDEASRIRTALDSPDENNADGDGDGQDSGETEPSAKAETGLRSRSRSEHPARRPSHRRYRIQEVVTRRQIMLVQVVKEERGNKGAALTTFLSLAGRYCVLMPNTPRGGGVSRKITNLVDRKRLKQVVEGLDVPKDMAVIVRTAGSQRTKTEIKRDYEYLLRLWDQIRELTLESAAPCLVHEEANLIKRSIRDLYTRDIDEVLVEGEEGYRIAKGFMKMLVPSHARRVQPFSNGGVPLFHHFQVESQLDAIYSSTVQLRSGGYIVLNQTEALVAVDVNSGRSTRERNIEETALKTNLEAADEVARQLRLRDLAGLIVIDFIDMDESRNQYAIERRMKDMVKTDRARIQLGRISQFGLMELSRQRLRPSVAEASTQPCAHCEGTGRVRSIDSAALQVLRNIEDEGLKQQASEIVVHVPAAIGFYILNNKRDVLASTEERYAFRVSLQPDDTLVAPEHRIDRLGSKTASERSAVLEAIGAHKITVIEDDDDIEDEAEVEAEVQVADNDDTQSDRQPRRRRRRRSEQSPRDDEARTDSQAIGDATRDAEPDITTDDTATGDDQPSEQDDDGEDDDGAKRRRRRGKRGGRRRARRPQTGDENGNEVEGEAGDGTAQTNAVSPPATDVPETETQDGASVVNAQGGDAPPEGTPATKRALRPRRPRRRKEETVAEPVTETNTATEESAAEAPVAIEPAIDPTIKPEVATTAEGTSDAVLSDEATPEQPSRKGWWNRLLS
jgi:ribonuclease E